ncbi:MAG: hypothetical protein JWM78_2260 [Verrucomicrobiaceae bacterium]|nr:hypothetical protein [Verrucomicrobiaceae bacterium]
MSWITDFLGGGAANVIGEVGKIVDQFHMSDQEKTQFKLEMEALLQKRDSEIEQTLRAEMESKERVLVAELNQGDNFTKRARPTVVYAGLIFIFLNYCLIPAVQYLAGKPPVHCAQSASDCVIASGIQLPQEFWWAWAGIVGTWTIGRSFEKSNASNRVTDLITGSAAAGGAKDDAVG